MNRILFLVAIIILPLPAISEEVTRNAGDKSLNFSFSDFAIEDYKIGIGGKYWFSPKITMTCIIDYQNTTSELETSTGTPTQPETNFDSYGLSIGIERHFKSSTKLSPYLGGEIYYLDSESVVPGDFTSSFSEWGINVLFGAEYAFNKTIAFAAEYSLGYSDTESKINDTDSGTTTGTNKGFGLGSGKLLLLLYF